MFACCFAEWLAILRRNYRLKANSNRTIDIADNQRVTDSTSTIFACSVAGYASDGTHSTAVMTANNFDREVVIALIMYNPNKGNGTAHANYKANSSANDNSAFLNSYRPRPRFPSGLIASTAK